jgi:hypothetical protein
MTEGQIKVSPQATVTKNKASNFYSIFYRLQDAVTQLSDNASSLPSPSPPPLYLSACLAEKEIGRF